MRPGESAQAADGAAVIGSERFWRRLMTDALILFAHGSRDPRWAEPFRAIQRKVSAKKPHVTVELAFLELMEPKLAEVVDRLSGAGHTRVTIAPLFMAEGAHLKRDLTQLMRILQERHARLELRLLPPAGEDEAVLDAISTWAASSV
jgi:sirohydrochlorin cobaltochelatase